MGGTNFAFAAVAGGTYCRSIPAGRVGGCQTHVMEAAVYGIQEDVFVPMFLMDLSWCETCVIMTPCFNTGGLEALEALGPGLANRSRGATHYFNKTDALPDAVSAFIRSQLAKPGKWTYPPLRLGGAVLDVQARRLVTRGIPVPLSEMRADVLAVLLEPPAGHWKTRKEIARKVMVT